MREALWIDLRTGRGISRRLLFDAHPPRVRRERERALREAVEQVFPSATIRSYSGGVAQFEWDDAVLVAHFGAVRDGAELLPLRPLDLARLRDDEELHPSGLAEGSSGIELQLRLI